MGTPKVTELRRNGRRVEPPADAAAQQTWATMTPQQQEDYEDAAERRRIERNGGTA